ncbi:MAG: hypothetical protein VYE22_09915 [Myxococcota bacterium]|nr:hypothetical protein [Myxococcota bacterium]
MISVAEDHGLEENDVEEAEGATKERVADEVAEHEFTRFVEAMDLDLDPEHMSEEDRAGFEQQKRYFLGAVQEGRLTVDERGQPVFQPSSGGALKFREPNGAALMEMDKGKRNENQRKLHLLMAAITKSPPARFAKMPKRDLKVCTAIVIFLMQG